MANEFWELLEKYLPNKHTKTQRETSPSINSWVNDILWAKNEIWIKFTHNTEIQIPQCFLWINDPYPRKAINDKLKIKKWDVLLASNELIYWYIQLDERHDRKYITSAICCRWDIWSQWMMSFLAWATDQFWIHEDCQNYNRLLDYFSKRQGI